MFVKGPYPSACNHIQTLGPIWFPRLAVRFIECKCVKSEFSDKAKVSHDASVFDQLLELKHGTQVIAKFINECSLF